MARLIHRVELDHWVGIFQMWTLCVRVRVEASGHKIFGGGRAGGDEKNYWWHKMDEPD